MNIAEVFEKTIRITFEYENAQKVKSSIWADVREESLTISTWAKIQTFQKDEDGYKLAEALSEMVTDWSVDFNGELYPPTFENLCKVPFPFVVALISAIGETWSGNVQTPSESANGSAGSAKSKTKKET